MEELSAFVSQTSKSGVFQGNSEWHLKKLLTIGGSQISTVMGLNPYENVAGLVAERIGITAFKEGLPMWWGNLFELPIEKFVELDKKTTIIGNEIFIMGKAIGTSYSPDGLGVVEGKKVLFEFKCPFTRMPTDKVPKYYKPQVLYGLDIIECVDIGLFIEGVFRICAYEDLGLNTKFNTLLTPKSTGKPPLAYGFVGFYFDKENFNSLKSKYNDADMKAQKTLLDLHYISKLSLNKTNDLGNIDVGFFELIMKSVEMGILKYKHYDMCYVDNNFNEQAANEKLANNIVQYETDCVGFIRYGILPWKLFSVNYHYIEREKNFLNDYLPTILNIVGVIKECLDPANKSKKNNIYSEFVESLGYSFC